MRGYTYSVMHGDEETPFAMFDNLNDAVVVSKLMGEGFWILRPRAWFEED